MKSNVRNFEQWLRNCYRHQKESSIKRGHTPPAYSKEELAIWTKGQINFREVFDNWKNNNFLTKFIPSIDRLKDELPYTFENIRLVTWEENNLKATIKNNEKLSKPVLKICKNTSKILDTYKSIAEAGRLNKARRTNINYCCKNNHRTAGGFKWKYKDESN